MAEKFPRHSALESSLFPLPGEVEVSKSSSLSSFNLAAEDENVSRITLSVSALFVTVLGIVLSIHLLHSTLTSVLILIALLSFIIHQDYQAFISLGRGGTTSDWMGYLKMTVLRCFVLSDPYSPAPIIHTVRPSTGCFRALQATPLPQRNGPRPRVVGIAPQRQLNQPGSADAYASLRQAFIKASQNNPSHLRIGISCFEKHGLALFSTRPLNITCKGEVAHIHHSDRSMHMNLHPEDAKMVLEQGWGQRHPLAQGGWMQKYVPKEFTMVYAPRNREELEVVARIVEAAAWWVAGERLAILIPQR